MASGPEIATRKNVLGLKNRDQIVPLQASSVFLDFENYILVVLSFIIIILQQPNAWNIFQTGAIYVKVPAVRRNEFANTIERCDAHGSGDLRHFAISSDADNIIVTGETKVAHQAHFIGKSIIIRYCSSPFERIEKLCRVEAENFRVSKASYHFPLMRAAKCVRGIINQREVMSLGDVIQQFHIAGSPPKVNGDDSSRPGRDHSFYF